jgi:predicted secreted protein
MTFAPSIEAQPGRLFLLKVSDGTSPTTFVTVGGVRATSMTLNNNPVDITNVASNGYRELLPDGGVQSFSMALEGIMDSQTQGAVLLFTAARNRTLIECQIVSGHGDEFRGNMAVNQFQRNGAFDNAEVFSCQLESSGQLLYIPGA